MTDRAALFKALRSPVVLGVIGATLLIFIIWLAAIFLPEQSKVGKLDTQRTTLQAQQTALKIKLKNLRGLQNSDLAHLHSQYSGLVPSSTDTSQYLKQINAILFQSGAGLQTISFGQPTAPLPVTAATKSLPHSSADLIAVTLVTRGTYDQELRLLKLIYQAPRLTTISGVSLNGGGPATTRTTQLTGTFNMTIYELPPGSSTSAGVSPAT